MQPYKTNIVRGYRKDGFDYRPTHRNAGLEDWRLERRKQISYIQPLDDILRIDCTTSCILQEDLASASTPG